MYINPLTGDRDNYNTWTVENTYAAKFEHWTDSSPQPAPQGWVTINSTYFEEVYELLPKALQEHLGVGY
jgi:hypothetical protein